MNDQSYYLSTVFRTPMLLPGHKHYLSGSLLARHCRKWMVFLICLVILAQSLPHDGSVGKVIHRTIIDTKLPQGKACCEFERWNRGHRWGKAAGGPVSC